MRLLPVLVGEAPSQATEGLPPFSGRSGARLVELLGRAPSDAFVVVNVLDRWPGPSPRGEKGSAFPLEEAVAGARRLVEELGAPGRRWVLCGWRVRDAFARAVELSWRTPRYLSWEHLRGHGLDGSEMYAVLPHPSGVNRWWNASSNVAKARRFLRDAARGIP